MSGRDSKNIIDPKIRSEFERWNAKIGPHVEQAESESHLIIGTLDVLFLHFLVADFFANQVPGEGVGGVGPRDADAALLQSAVGRQLAGFGGKQKWTEKYDLVATLFFGLVKGHAFHDCNKRTALVSALAYLERVGRTPKTKERELDELAERTAATDGLRRYPKFPRFDGRPDAEVRFLADWFRSNTRDVDRRDYIVTFRALDATLRSHGYFLDDPSGNSIGVFRKEEKKSLFGFRKSESRTRVGVVGFPGWKDKISSGDLRKVRKMTGLTPENGCDSQVFYGNVEPMESLLVRYSAPLKRLANK